MPVSATPLAKTALEQSTSINLNTGCTFEYNMNSMVDNLVITGADITKADGSMPFKKLFPIDSVVKPARPLGAGIKYGITGDVGSGTYRNPRSSIYTINYRTYYPGAETYYKYFLSAKGVGVDINIAYPKTILTNKIIARFEISHSTPTTWNIYANGSSVAQGTSTQIKPFASGQYDAGTLIIYYNGSSWVTTEPAALGAPISITSVKLTTGGVSDKYIGVIEISPRMVLDVSSFITDISISKESSTSAEDILPIGKVSANSLSMNLASYEALRKIISFDKTFDFDSSKIYLYKKIEVKPYFKLYGAFGTLTDSGGTYEKINQGTFYLDNWSTSEYGDISINALDGAKTLQDVIAPSIICEGYSAIAILRRLLDSVGFTNYNFNLSPTDTSVFSPKFWWTDDSKTVWNAIQELCRDSQITAVFDENNVLQFYTRDYMFNSSKAADWSFRYLTDGSNLSNILSLSKNDLASANQVKVLWKSVTTSEYVGNSQPLWKSGVSSMAALSLDQDLPSAVTEGGYIALSPITINTYQAKTQLIDEYSGYLVIDSEIIEYDAIQYEYLNQDNTKTQVWITSASDTLKYLGSGVVGSDNYKPSGRYRIKARGAFNTTPANHYAAAQTILSSWSGYNVRWIG
jgi:hypothetical protein